MQTAQEVGKYVTDGKKVYPYNAHLDDLVKNGTLQYCEKPTNVKNSPKPVFRSPITYTPEERLEMARKLGITLGELTNMSPQEFETALADIAAKDAAPAAPVVEVKEGFPT
jgi:hypothetical protein